MIKKINSKLAIILICILLTNAYAFAETFIDKNNPPKDLTIIPEYGLLPEYLGYHFVFNENLNKEEMSDWGNTLSPSATGAKFNQFFFYTGQGKNGERIGVVNTRPGTGKYTTIYVPRDDPKSQYALMMDLGYEITPEELLKHAKNKAPEQVEPFKLLPLRLSGQFQGLTSSDGESAIKLKISNGNPNLICKLIKTEAPIIDANSIPIGSELAVRGFFEKFDDDLILTDCYFTLSEKKESSFDFRRVRWGMSADDVKKAEDQTKNIECGLNPIPKITYVCYAVQLDNKPYTLIYEFVNDKLYSALYGFDQEYLNKNNYIDDFEKLKDQLFKRYGQPANDETVWSDPMFKNKPEKWGMAYSLGEVKSEVWWENDKTRVGLVLTGENYKILLFIKYLGQQFLGEAQKVHEDHALSDL